jgi:diguanylate cyclase (GGDEF)-like protein
MLVALSPEDASLLSSYAVKTHNDVGLGLENLLKRHITYYRRPPEIEHFLSETMRLRDALNRQPVYIVHSGTHLVGVPDDLVPALIRVILTSRRALAASVEVDRSRTAHADLRKALDSVLAPFDRFRSSPWFRADLALSAPRASDFLPLEYAIEEVNASMPLADREYDEKFHLLQAPSLFLADLQHFRAMCEMRNRPLAVGFIDIDDFKSLNTEHGENVVDRDLLPRFMRRVEAEMFMRGFAYRFGGDEYVTLLPNAAQTEATTLHNAIRVGVADIRYPGIARTTTVSVGFCEVEPDSVWTGQEILARANAAKTFAKSSGKNRVATYRKPSDALYIVAGAGASLEET